MNFKDEWIREKAHIVKLVFIFVFLSSFFEDFEVEKGLNF